MPLTTEQTRSLAEALIGTTGNVNYLTKKMFRLREFTEGNWISLENVGRVFRCDDCRTWKSAEERVAEDIDQCRKCSK